ncbi:MAG: thioredoxin family protein [Thermoflavifilum sp.]|nr:thioredoxin family protein [Thermoflavifilum sp.]
MSKFVLPEEKLQAGFGYTAYLQYVHQLVIAGETSGSVQHPQLVHFTRLNERRMQRLEKTVQLLPELIQLTHQLEVSWYWVILTEAWCGDAAQHIPVIEKIAREIHEVHTVYLLHDQHLDLMDRYLTRNGRAIPKLICFSQTTREEIFQWGPRPTPAQDLFWRLHDQGIPHDQIVEKVQYWYLHDHARTIQQEFMHLLQPFLQP